MNQAARSQLRAVFYKANMMSHLIYWMLTDSQQAAQKAPGILSPSELQKYSAFRFPKRRDEWLLGRWTAKTLAHSIPVYQQYPLNQIEIRNAPEGAPYIQLPERNARAECLTISHSGSLALCALATGLELQVGADIEKVEERTETFILDYFTSAERQLVNKYTSAAKEMVVTLIWSAKESMLKALGVGLRRDTRMVEVHGLESLLPDGDGHKKWQRIQIGEQPTSQRVWAGWWQRRDSFVLTLAGFASTQAEIQSARLLEKQVE